MDYRAGTDADEMASRIKMPIFTGRGSAAASTSDGLVNLKFG